MHPRAKILKEHTDWFVYDKLHALTDGLKISNWSHFPIKRFLLDIRKVEVQKYLENVFESLFVEIGFELVKLDFLYAIYFNSQMSISESDDQLNKFLTDLKKRYPAVYTVACGCPLVPAIGAVDSLRIAKDSSIELYFPRWLGFLGYFINVIHAKIYLRALIKNYKERVWSKCIWNLDLDFFIFDKARGFSKKDLSLLLRLIKESNGNVFLGGDLTKITDEDKKNYIYPLLNIK
ncbi:hypothetical protein HYV31_00760 [candidate division WWE3 bacterium]|nr:hypothetical protein [candidate division WWE3 bacterium]